MLKITTIINKTPVWIGVLIILCLNFLGFQLQGNEEMYLLLAKQFYHPDFIQDSFNLNQFPSNRLLYQYLTGYMLEYFTFEQTALLGRTVLCFLLAFPIAKIIKVFKLSMIEGLFILQVFFFANQAFFADAWLFLSFESKCISYFFVLWAMYNMLINRLNISILLLVIATWFHILVGGWTFLFLFVYMIFQKCSVKELFGRAFVYSILIAPLIWYLSQEILMNTATLQNGIHIDWIYTHYRNAHHTVPSHFSIIGIAMMIAWGLVSLLFFTKLDQVVLKRINLFNLICIAFLLLSFGIATVDPNGVFTKFYPFRPNSLLKFFIIFEMAMVLKLWVIQPSFSPYINAALFVFLIPYLIAPTSTVLQTYEPPSQNELLWDDFTTHIQQNTPKDAIFIHYSKEKNSDADGKLSFSRKTQRNRFAIYEFVPSGGQQIHAWYERLQERNKLADNLDYLKELNQKYRLDYLVSKERLQIENLELKYSNDKHYLYKINRLE